MCGDNEKKAASTRKLPSNSGSRTESRYGNTAQNYIKLFSRDSDLLGRISYLLRFMNASLKINAQGTSDS